MERHDLGVVQIKAGEILSFAYLDHSNQKQSIIVVAIEDIDLSKEMAEFAKVTEGNYRKLFTENSLPEFIEHLSSKGMLHVSTTVNIDFGIMGRPSRRLSDEYRFSINPESFWDDKLYHRYSTTSFSVCTHQDHMLTVLANVEAPFYIQASIVDSEGYLLGMLRLSVISDNKHTLLNEDDIERIRLALQADIVIGVPEINVLVDEVKLINNPEFGVCQYSNHFSFEGDDTDVNVDNSEEDEREPVGVA